MNLELVEKRWFMDHGCRERGSAESWSDNLGS